MKYNTAVKMIWALVIVTGGVISTTATSSHADGNIASDDSVTLTVTSSCYISSTVTSAHTATISNGTLQSNIGSTSIKTVCNDPLGYALYAVGYDTEMGDGGTNLKSSDGLTIATGLATSGSTSSWAMKLSAVDGTDKPTILYASDYATVPSEPTKVAHYEHAVGSSEGSTVTTTYRAYVSPTQAAGTYEGSVKYTLMHPDNATNGIASISTMQAMTSEKCAASNIGEIAYLKDTRDNKYYRVGKMRDGYCWMIDNLRFGGVNASGTPITITSSDSDVSANFSLIASTPTGSAYTMETSWTQGRIAGGAGGNKSEYYPDDSKYPDSDFYYGYYYNWYAATAGTGTADMTSGQNATSSICPKGWQLPVDSNSTEVDTKSFARLLYMSGVINSKQNIGTGTDVDYATGGKDILTAAPLSFLFAGNHDTIGNTFQAVAGRGSIGAYWSSSATSATYAYNSLFKSSNIKPRFNEGEKTRGLSVRCVAR